MTEIHGDFPSVTKVINNSQLSPLMGECSLAETRPIQFMFNMNKTQSKLWS